jgi:hypothetical protein
MPSSALFMADPLPLCHKLIMQIHGHTGTERHTAIGWVHGRSDILSMNWRTDGRTDRLDWQMINWLTVKQRHTPSWSLCNILILDKIISSSFSVIIYKTFFALKISNFYYSNLFLGKCTEDFMVLLQCCKFK